MRIAIVIPSMAGGGAERVISLLSRAWDAMGHEVSITTFAPASHDDYLLEANVQRYALDLMKESNSLLSAVGANWRRVMALRRLLRRSLPDVVIGVMPTCSVLSSLAATGLGIRVVASERSYPPMAPIGRAWGLLRRLVYPRTASVVAQTQKGAQWLTERCRGSRVEIIPNPVLWPLPIGEATALAKAPSGDDLPFVLAAGRLHREKGLDLLIDAFARIAARHAGWRLVILGEGQERDALESLAQATGFADRIQFAGRVSNVQDWYERAGLFVLSSRFEGFPNALAEAMSCGCAAVSFDCDTGPSDLIDDGVNGVLVPVDQGVAALAATIDGLLADPQRRRQLGARAQEVRERFALPLIARQWEQLLLDVRQVA